MPYRAQTLAIQKAVRELGYDPGPLDGWFGDKTAAGVDAWLTTKGEPAQTDKPRVGLSRIVWHWSAGTHAVSAADREHYHFIVAGDGSVVEGDHPPEDNISAGDGVYAAHTRNCNTGAIGIAVAAMAGAQERPFDPGSWPITPAQVDALVALTARLAEAYGIGVSRQTMLSHAEVQPTLGIAQLGKWDITWLPGMMEPADPVTVGGMLRDRVAARIGGG